MSEGCVEKRDKGEKERDEKWEEMAERDGVCACLCVTHSRKLCPEASLLCLLSVKAGQQQCHTQLKTFTGSQEAHLDSS